MLSPSQGRMPSDALLRAEGRDERAGQSLTYVVAVCRQGGRPMASWSTVHIYWGLDTHYVKAYGLSHVYRA